MVVVFTRLTDQLYEILKKDANSNFMSVSRTIFLRLLLSYKEHPTLDDVIWQLKTPEFREYWGETFCPKEDKNGDLSTL